MKIKNRVLKCFIVAVMFIPLFITSCSEDLKIAPPEETEDEFEGVNLQPDNLPLVAQIGKLPVALESMKTFSSEFRSINLQNFNNVLPKDATSLIINADEVPDIAGLANSIMIEDALSRNVVILVGANKDKNKEELLLNLLGGPKFEGAELSMLYQDREDENKLKIVPVGKKKGFFVKEELTDFLTPHYAQNPSVEEDSIMSNSINFDNLLEQNQDSEASARTNITIDHTFNNVKIPTTVKLYWNLQAFNYSSLHSDKLRWIRTYVKRYRKYFLAQSEVQTLITGGQSTITFRETIMYAKGTTKTVVHGIRVGGSIGTTWGTSPGFQVSAEVSGMWGNDWGKTTTVQSQITTGQTYYTSPCVYACCDAKGFYQYVQMKYKKRYGARGEVILNYVASNVYGSAKIKFKYYPPRGKLSALSTTYYKWGTPHYELAIVKKTSTCKSFDYFLSPSNYRGPKCAAARACVSIAPPK